MYIETQAPSSPTFRAAIHLVVDLDALARDLRAAALAGRGLSCERSRVASPAASIVRACSSTREPAPRVGQGQRGGFAPLVAGALMRAA